MIYNKNKYILKSLTCLLTILCLFNCSISLSQFVKNVGIPFIVNYLPETYKASDQNWSILQDERGIMYFGNTLGVLEFDGITWELIKLPNSQAVRSILENENGTVYVGGINELGYLKEDTLGIIKYVSLMNLIPNKYKNFGDVWSINNYKGNIIFRTYHYLFLYKNYKIRTIEAKNLIYTSSIIDQSFYISEDNSGINKLSGDSLKPIYQNIKSKVEHPTVLPYDKNHLLLASRLNGLYLFDGSNLTKWGIGIDSFLSKNILYSAIQIDSQYYAFGTWLGGLLIVDKKGRPIQCLNKSNGLASNAVYNIYIDREKNLWCALGHGIAKIEINSPFTIFLNSKEIKCYTAAIYNNDLYIGGDPYICQTKLENFHNPLSNIPFKIITKNKPQIWQLKKLNNELFAACSFNLLNITNTKIEEINMQNEIVWTIQPIKNNPSLLLVGKNDGIYVLEKVNSHWKIRNKISGIDETIRWLESDNNNNYWSCNLGNKIYKLNFDNDYRKINQLKSYELDLNYPLAISDRINLIDSEIIAASSNGFYRYDVKTDKFEPYKKLNALFTQKGPVNIAGLDNNGNIWYTDKYGLGELVKRNNDSYSVFRTPFYKFDPPSETYPIISLNDSNTIMEIANLLIHYDPKYKKNYDLSFKTLIRKIELLENDSIIYYGGKSKATEQNLSKKEFIQLNYKYNSIRFHFSASFYENIEKTKFRCKLIGYDKNWSNWTFDTKKDYTNLSEGKYTFIVESLNVYQKIGESSIFSFTIKPPWFRTIWAYSLYIIIVIGLIYILLYLNSRRLKHANIELENIIKERTNEINQQKEEIQIHFENLKEINALKDKLYSIISFKFSKSI